MKRFLLILIFFCYFQNANAQYTEIINSKRPGFSESPYGVGSDVYQFEFGMCYHDFKNSTSGTPANAFGSELFFRFGKFIEKLEVNLQVMYQSNKINNSTGGTDKLSGINGLRFGAKYLIYQQEYTDKSKEIRSWKARTSFDKKRLIPSVGIYVGVNPNINNDISNYEDIGYRVALLLQNDFSDRLVLITNFMGDQIASEDMLYSYLVTLTYTLGSNWSVFGENVGEYHKVRKDLNEYQIGLGTAYLLSPDLQIDASVRSLLSSDATNMYINAGISWRLDKHQDKLIEDSEELPDENGMGKKKKGFFSNLFKKKNK